MPYKVIAPQGTDPRDPFKNVDYLFRYPASKDTPEGWMTWQDHPIDRKYFALFHYDATKMTLRDGHIYWYSPKEREALEYSRKKADLVAQLEGLKVKEREAEYGGLHSLKKAVEQDSTDWEGLKSQFPPAGVEEKSDKDSIRVHTRRPRPYDPNDVIGPGAQLTKESAEAVNNSVRTVEGTAVLKPVKKPKVLVEERVTQSYFFNTIYRRYHIGSSEVLEVSEVYFMGIRYKYTSVLRVKGLKDTFKALY